MTEKHYPILKRLIAVETHIADNHTDQVIRLDFEVDNPDDLFQVEVVFDPSIIAGPEQLKPLFDKYRIAIAPHSIDVWDEAVATLLACE